MIAIGHAGTRLIESAQAAVLILKIFKKKSVKNLAGSKNSRTFANANGNERSRRHHLDASGSGPDFSIDS